MSVEKGVIIKSTGLWYDVLVDHRTIPCRIIGKYRLEGNLLTNPAAVGDRVTIELANDGTGSIQEIEPRKNYVPRQSPHNRMQVHLLATNVDQVALIITWKEPMLKPGFIDRYLLMTEPYNIPVLIICNKADLLKKIDLENWNAFAQVYQRIGYATYTVSAKTGEGIDVLKNALVGKITLFSGQSGVGKSSLLNKLEPGLGLKTGDISQSSGKGQHVTTFAEMFPLLEGGSIIDTPGIKTLSFNHLTPQDIAHNFREFFAFSDSCRFGGGCMHLKEPGCAVKEAVEAGKIAPWRYAQYLQIMEETEDQKYWERRNEV